MNIWNRISSQDIVNMNWSWLLLKNFQYGQKSLYDNTFLLSLALYYICNDAIFLKLNYILLFYFHEFISWWISSSIISEYAKIIDIFSYSLRRITFSLYVATTKMIYFYVSTWFYNEWSLFFEAIAICSSNQYTLKLNFYLFFLGKFIFKIIV